MKWQDRWKKTFEIIESFYIHSASARPSTLRFHGTLFSTFSSALTLLIQTEKLIQPSHTFTKLSSLYTLAGSSSHIQVEEENALNIWTNSGAVPECLETWIPNWLKFGPNPRFFVVAVRLVSTNFWMIVSKIHIHNLTQYSNIMMVINSYTLKTYSFAHI